MALYEFRCQKCDHEFEQITSSSDPDQGKCPQCGAHSSQRLISRFWVAGQGDLRESTHFHGCHDHDAGHGDHDHSHDHDHDHSSHEKKKDND